MWQHKALEIGQVPWYSAVLSVRFHLIIFILWDHGWFRWPHRSRDSLENLQNVGREVIEGQLKEALGEILDSI